MSGVNKAILLGNIGADPELRFTQSNKALLKFRMATSENYLAESGEKKEVTHWHNVQMWGKRAEALSKILTKGMTVFVEGRIETRTYDDKDGVKRSATDINASNLEIVGSKRDGTSGGQLRTEQKAAPKHGDPVGRDEIQDDDFAGF
jgi:single-strand DNA-binding protein